MARSGWPCQIAAARRAFFCVLVASIVLLAVKLAHADVDWSRGLVTAGGLGIADRHAPSPAAAREPARRVAEDAARAKIKAQLPALPLAEGGTLKAKLADKTIAARIDRAVAAAITVEATPHTDGSWNVTLAVPIEAVRQAIAGPRALATSDADPAVVVVEGVTAKPAVGYTVGKIAGATLFAKTVPEWAKDAPRVKASGAKAGAIEVASPQGGPATLFVLVP
jgi:hypothetical protein